jgi:hypothetical protein
MTGLFYFYEGDRTKGSLRERISLMLRGSQAGFIGRHRGLAPCGSEARKIPLGLCSFFLILIEPKGV